MEEYPLQDHRFPRSAIRRVRVFHPYIYDLTPQRLSQRCSQIAMPRIFDNIEKELLPAPRETTKLFDRAGKHVD